MLSEREANILSTLAQMRFMTTSQIHRLHGYLGEYGLKVTRRLLVKLEQDGLIMAWQPTKYAQKIHYLTKLGAKTMEYCYGYEHIPTFRRNEKALHQTYVSEAYVALKTAGPGQLHRFAINKKYGEVIPDAVIDYEWNGRLYTIYLEVDTGNESLLYLRDVKLAKYLRTFSGYPDPGARRSIVFLTLQEHRRNALRRMTEPDPLPISVFGVEELSANPSILFDESIIPRREFFANFVRPPQTIHEGPGSEANNETPPNDLP
ncbi:hypothetical protein SD70_26150 [Gordoniibacillus kamchatkensis]|uniref:Replication-relaxation n=1 Tax=Gordoniibacillus kamchatkensis TaxID=1590651 RepID=A0ABR5ACZ5_9BACL|nr:hypothetical protein SD70_26150 [Paenibacillus sp. VKM B-2647]